MNEMENYINSLKRKNTKIYYHLCLDKYFKAINSTPNDYFKNKKQKTKKYENDIKKFVSSINKLAPVTQKNYISVIKSFFLDNDIELKHSFWKREVKNKIEEGGALTLDRAPTPEELKKILTYGDLKARALFTLSASSGMRISEITQLQLNDIDLDHDPGKISIRSTYVKGKRKPRWAFMSNEAKELIRLWLDKPQKINGEKPESERERYLRVAVEKIKSCRPTKNPIDNRVFPFGDCMARTMWYRLIHKANTDKKSTETDRYELHVHSLRKFFMSQMKLSTPEVVVEALAGHSRYLDEAYRRYSVDQLAGFYKHGMGQVMIFETAPDFTEINEALKVKDQQITDLNKKLDDMNQTMLMLVARNQARD